MTDSIIIGTRGSMLALWQANFVADSLRKIGLSPSIKTFKTTGDIIQDRFLHEIGGKGLFIRELEEALARGECDLAVHSLKDMPVLIPNDFKLCATMKRHAVEDLLVIHPDGKLKNAPSSVTHVSQLNLENSHIATSSLRRESYLKKFSSTVRTEPVRGNVDTRLRKMLEQSWDGILLARASLDRLDLMKNYQTAILSADMMIPCAGQGALAIEMRADHALLKEVSKLNDPTTYREITVERAVLRKLGGDCTMPFGCLARANGKTILVRTIVLARSGECAESNLNFHEEPEQQIADRVISDLKGKGLLSIFQQLGIHLPQ